MTATTIAEARAQFIRRELARGETVERAYERWASYAAGPGYTYLARLARAASEQPVCVNCDHAAHDHVRCTGTSDEGRYACACSWPNPDNYTD